MFVSVCVCCGMFVVLVRICGVGHCRVSKLLFLSCVFVCAGKCECVCVYVCLCLFVCVLCGVCCISKHMWCCVHKV